MQKFIKEYTEFKSEITFRIEKVTFYDETVGRNTSYTNYYRIGYNNEFVDKLDRKEFIKEVKNSKLDIAEKDNLVAEAQWYSIEEILTNEKRIKKLIKDNQDFNNDLYNEFSDQIETMRLIEEGRVFKGEHRGFIVELIYGRAYISIVNSFEFINGIDRKYLVKEEKEIFDKARTIIDNIEDENEVNRLLTELDDLTKNLGELIIDRLYNDIRVSDKDLLQLFWYYLEAGKLVHTEINDKNELRVKNYKVLI